jgi:hypothetical protein
MQEHLTFPSSPLSANSPPTNQTPLNTTLPLPTASSTTPHPTPTPTKLSTPRPWLSGPAPTPASCPDQSRVVWLAARLGLETPHPTSLTLTHPQKVTDKVGKTNSSLPVFSAFHSPTSYIFLLRPLSPSPRLLSAHTRGGSVQSPPLLFVDNECAIGLATSSVRPKKSKSIDMRLDWIRERAGQNNFRLVFLPGLIAALPFLHGTPHDPQPPHNFATTTPPTTPHHHQRSSAAMQSATGTHLP